jgi:hypothetical protein
MSELDDDPRPAEEWAPMSEIDDPRPVEEWAW